MKSSPPLLTTRHLTVGYKAGGKRHVIAGDLNLELFPGAMVCLIGPNGAGKSTLLRTLAGLQQPLSGEVYLAGENMNLLSASALAQRLSVVLSERIEPGNLTAAEVVSLGRTPYTGWFGGLAARDMDKISWSMEVTATTPFRDKPLIRLSDGEKQKVLLARALAQDTPIILLDEPTAHLDLPSRVEIMYLLRQLARDTEKAILLSTHELDLALEVADQLWVLQAEGTHAAGMPEQLVLDGTFEKIFSQRGVVFDKNSGRFQTPSDELRFSVALTGPRELQFWTSKALLRAGIGSSDTAPRYKIEINDRPHTTWILTAGQKQHLCSSLEELMQAVLASEHCRQTEKFGPNTGA